MAPAGSVIQGFFPRGLAQLTNSVRPPPATTARPEWVQRRIAPGHPAPVQLKQAPRTHASPNATSVQLSPHVRFPPSSLGQKLAPPVLQMMESLFGARFEDVRIHVGPQAASIGAVAFTQGSHIHFATGRYDPVSAQGRQILGHELAHVVQQRAGRVRNPFGSGIAVVQDRALEAEADRMGQRAAIQRLPATTIQRVKVDYGPIKTKVAAKEWTVSQKYIIAGKSGGSHVTICGTIGKDEIDITNIHLTLEASQTHYSFDHKSGTSFAYKPTGQMTQYLEITKTQLDKIRSVAHVCGCTIEDPRDPNVIAAEEQAKTAAAASKAAAAAAKAKDAAEADARAAAAAQAEAAAEAAFAASKASSSSASQKPASEALAESWEELVDKMEAATK